MRILSTIALAVLAVAASAQSYTITGKAGEASNGKKAFLVDQNAAKICDSCVIADGAFKFESKITGEKLMEVNIDKSRRTKAVVLAAEGTNAVVDFAARPATVTDNGGYNDKLAAIISTIVEKSNAINAATSACGRFQFSVENVYRVRYLTPSLTASSTRVRTVAAPAW